VTDPYNSFDPPLSRFHQTALCRLEFQGCDTPGGTTVMIRVREPPMRARLFHPGSSLRYLKFRHQKITSGAILAGEHTFQSDPPRPEDEETKERSAKGSASLHLISSTRNSARSGGPLSPDPHQSGSGSQDPRCRNTPSP